MTVLSIQEKVSFCMIQIPDERVFIAIIDDSQTVRKILETEFSREGYLVKAFATPLEAFRAFLNPEPKFPLPNILFVDIRLPQFDGYEVMRRFRKAPGGEHIHIITITRNNGVIDRVLAKIAGSNDYLTKPFTNTQLIAVVNSYLQS